MKSGLSTESIRPIFFGSQIYNHIREQKIQSDKFILKSGKYYIGSA